MKVAANLTSPLVSTYPSLYPSAPPLCQVEVQIEPPPPPQNPKSEFRKALMSKWRTSKVGKLKNTLPHQQSF